MPYIKQEKRKDFDDLIEQIAIRICGAGDLNYCVSKLIYLLLGNNASYADYNQKIGVLECAKLELYRKMVAPYENSKALENGEVYNG